MNETQFQNRPPEDSPESDGWPVNESEIRQALRQLVRSKALAGSEKLIRFLTFIVETTIHGEGSHLKETVIGNSVFGRPPDYDPKADTIVRSQAWRLRTKLTEYYRIEGAAASVRILLRRGSYVPFFVRSSEVTEPPEQLKPTG